MKMLSIKKILISVRLTYFQLNHQISLNRISTKIQKRFIKSRNLLEKCNQFAPCTICNQSKVPLSSQLVRIRCLSTKTPQKITKIGPIDQKTNKTTASLKELAKESEEKLPKIETIGIIGLHKWQDLKNIKEWICVYHFPYINHLRTFQRLKLYLTVINFGFVPVSLISYSSGAVDLEVVTFYCMVSLFSMFAMYIFGHLFSRFVGRIYISDDGKFVRLSNLSFFGNRIDTDIDREDVVPLMDSNNQLNDWYCGIEQFSTSKQLYMSLKFGGIVNREGFEKVFGEDAIKFFAKNRN